MNSIVATLSCTPYHPQQVISEVNRYNYIKALNSGSFGEVYLVYDKEEQRQVAMKIINLENQNEEVIEECIWEAQLSLHLNHPNVVSTYECFRTETELFLISEYCEGGDLNEKINPLSGLDEVAAVKYLHINGLAHRDIKPENVMLTDQDSVRLIDFGLSGAADEEVGLVGTLPFMSPEIYCKKTTNMFQNNGKSADIWALGITLYKMIVGKHPFDCPSHHDPDYKTFLRNNNRFENESSHTQKSWTTDLHDLFSGLLHVCPQSRWTIEQIEDFLSSKGNLLFFKPKCKENNDCDRLGKACLKNVFSEACFDFYSHDDNDDSAVECNPVTITKIGNVDICYDYYHTIEIVVNDDVPNFDREKNDSDSGLDIARENMKPNIFFQDACYAQTKNRFLSVGQSPRHPGVNEIGQQLQRCRQQKLSETRTTYVFAQSLGKKESVTIPSTVSWAEISDEDDCYF
eukprot:Awhi_evm1s15123